ncbi:hypothetical protein HPB51_018525 [Rhipicephalus microplus]|uniref:Uncharacterized protein n=1 Tax=Rhipicephalus microplus TaxID=6941 RepID=A0A9J6EHY4_RHIMP|nr:hypothetical protein HPB51_018525 [Rhipicephalus microplus]
MSDEAIVASVVEVSPNDSDEDDMESDNTGDPGVTVAEAAHCVSVMRVFAKKRGLAEKLAHSINVSVVAQGTYAKIDLLGGPDQEGEPLDKNPRKIETAAQAQESLRLLRNRVECLGGDYDLTICLNRGRPSSRPAEAPDEAS